MHSCYRDMKKPLEIIYQTSVLKDEACTFYTQYRASFTVVQGFNSKRDVNNDYDMAELWVTQGSAVDVSCR